MANRIVTLKEEAIESCRYRGHLMSRFKTTKFSKYTFGAKGKNKMSRALSRCVRDGCDAWVQVDVNPDPNGIDIGGPAVAVSCRGIRRDKAVVKHEPQSYITGSQ